jgi:hypothetical protein
MPKPTPDSIYRNWSLLDLLDRSLLEAANRAGVTLPDPSPADRTALVNEAARCGISVGSSETKRQIASRLLRERARLSDPLIQKQWWPGWIVLLESLKEDSCQPGGRLRKLFRTSKKSRSCPYNNLHGMVADLFARIIRNAGRVYMQQNRVVPDWLPFFIR